MLTFSTCAGISRSRVLALTLAAVGGLGLTPLTSGAHAATPSRAKAAPSSTSNVVVEWNHTLLNLVQTPGAQPATVHPTRDFAIMSAAVYDAVAASARLQFGTSRTDASGVVSPRAAAAQAAHDTVLAMFPGFADPLDRQLSADLDAVAPGRARTAGVHTGARAAARVLRERAGDGSDNPGPPYQSTGAAGDFRPTPPAFANPVFAHWGTVTPFVLRSGDQFRPPAPPALNSLQYAAAINEVRRLGQDTSTDRSAEQTTIGQFWAAPIQNYWNAIAEQLAQSRHDDARRQRGCSPSSTSVWLTPRSRCTTPSTRIGCGVRSAPSGWPTPTATG